MTLGLELGGAFLGGIGCTIMLLGVFGPRFVRWYMKRKLGGMMNLTGVKMQSEPSSDKPVYSTRPSLYADKIFDAETGEPIHVTPVSQDEPAYTAPPKP